MATKDSKKSAPAEGAVSEQPPVVEEVSPSPAAPVGEAVSRQTPEDTFAGEDGEEPTEAETPAAKPSKKVPLTDSQRIANLERTVIGLQAALTSYLKHPCPSEVDLKAKADALSHLSRV